MRNLIKKLIPYLFVILVLAGFFGLTTKETSASEANPTEPCVIRYFGSPTPVIANAPCVGADGTQYGTATPAAGVAAADAEATASRQTSGNAFQDEIDRGCGVSPTTWFNGCILKVFYYTYFQLPSLILYVVAQFFNAIVNLSIHSSITSSSGFISGAWSVVRDLSNIFFILVLLYVAIQTILGLSHETKKVIVRVIIMALLINFSMFMSKVVIDSSNILALVFYNKLQTNESRPIDASRPTGEKDISGDMWRTFDATRLISEDTIEKLKTTTIETRSDEEGGIGEKVVDRQKNLPFALTFGIIFIAGSIMLWAAYAFFIAGLMFIGRLIELWVLIIFSPFAFMSWTIPMLSGTPYIGWDEWSKKLISTSFMAPIFLFFIYLIFRLLPFISDIGGGNTTTWFGHVMKILIPALVVMALLLKATQFAKKGGGAFGEFILTAGKVLGGLALGGAGLGAAVIGRTAIARVAAGASRTDAAMAHGKYQFEMKKWSHGPKTTPPPTAPAVPLTSLRDKLGAKINKSQWESGDVSHARHEMDELKKKIGVEGLDDKFISGVDKQRMQDTYVKDKRSEVETDIIRGYDSKGKEVKLTTDDTKDKYGAPYTDAAGNPIEAVGKDDYMNKRRADAVDEVKTTRAAGDLDATGELTDQGRKKVENKLNQEFNEILKKAAGRIGKVKYKELQDEAAEKIGVKTKLMAKSTSGSYDVRNLADIKTDKREGLGTKATIGLVAAVAAGMRLGLKQGAGINSGTPQRDVWQDMKNVISESLKNAKIDVSFKSESSSHGGGDSHGTGGGGHH